MGARLEGMTDLQVLGWVGPWIAVAILKWTGAKGWGSGVQWVLGRPEWDVTQGAKEECNVCRSSMLIRLRSGSELGRRNSKLRRKRGLNVWPRLTF